MQRIRLGLAASAMTVLLAACGGEPASEQTTSPAATPAPVETPTTPAADDVTTQDGTTLAQFTADASAGETAFSQCIACHTVEPGVNRIGPSMAGIVGREAGSVAGFNYSTAMKDSGITWTPEKLNQFLENPRHVVPGLRMAYAGMKDGQKRADLIAYLERTGS